MVLISQMVGGDSLLCFQIPVCLRCLPRAAIITFPSHFPQQCHAWCCECGQHYEACVFSYQPCNETIPIALTAWHRLLHPAPEVVNIMMKTREKTGKLVSARIAFITPFHANIMGLEKAIYLCWRWWVVPERRPEVQSVRNADRITTFPQ